jgi:hypothetical protein
MSEPADDDPLARLVKRNRRARVGMGLTSIAAGAAIAFGGALPPFGLLAGLLLVALGLWMLIDRR